MSSSFSPLLHICRKLAPLVPVFTWKFSVRFYLQQKLRTVTGDSSSLQHRSLDFLHFPQNFCSTPTQERISRMILGTLPTPPGIFSVVGKKITIVFSSHCSVRKSGNSEEAWVFSFISLSFLDPCYILVRFSLVETPTICQIQQNPQNYFSQHD